MTQWEPLVRDFVALSSKLEQLGFTYRSGEVVIADRSDYDYV